MSAAWTIGRVTISFSCALPFYSNMCPMCICVQAAMSDLTSLSNTQGLLDDRGKFIYISLEEMEAVAKWIKLQGRISVGDLA
eukprot:2661438-Rhodomonas_salina.1